MPSAWIWYHVKPMLITTAKNMAAILILTCFKTLETMAKFLPVLEKLNFALCLLGLSHTVKHSPRTWKSYQHLLLPAIIPTCHLKGTESCHFWQNSYFSGPPQGFQVHTANYSVIAWPQLALWTCFLSSRMPRLGCFKGQHRENGLFLHYSQ